MSYVGKTCPVCQTPIKPGTVVSVCPACDMPYHQECWEYNGGCATYGCANAPRQGAQRPAAPATQPAAPPAAPAYPQAQSQTWAPPTDSSVWNVPQRPARSKAWMAAAAAALVMVGVVAFALMGSGHGTYPPPPPPGGTVDPGTTTPPPPPPEGLTRDRVVDFYNNWRNAWQSRDLTAYLSYYAEDCVVKRKGKSPYGKASLTNRMRDNFSKNSSINIESEEPDIHISGDRAELSVRQRYTSTTWWDRGTKYLTIEQRGDMLLIVVEGFSMEAGGKN